MTKQQILDQIESLELQLAEMTKVLYTVRKEIEEILHYE
jgi:regulator of replication initiation timing